MALSWARASEIATIAADAHQGSAVGQAIGDDDDRPVDEVQRVADPAEPAQRASAGDRRHRAARQQGAEDEQQRTRRRQRQQAARRRARFPAWRTIHRPIVIASAPVAATAASDRFGQHDRTSSRPTRARPRRRPPPSTRRPGCRCRSRSDRRRRRRRSGRGTTRLPSPRRRRTRHGPVVWCARRRARRAAPTTR